MTFDHLIIVAAGMICLLAILLTALRLPGTWCLVFGAALYGWHTNWHAITVPTLAIVAGIALFAEAVELLMSAVIAQRAGGSRRAAWGGLAGGFLGMFFLAFLIPVPLVGSMVGAIVGCFCGAAVAELSHRGDIGKGTRVGVFSALGMALGTAAKVGLALVMSTILMVSVWSNGRPSEEPALPLDTQLQFEARDG